MAPFWKSKKGIILQVCMALNVLALYFIDLPVIYYSKYLLASFILLLLIISLPVSRIVPHNKNINRPILKYVVFFLILSLFFGWPYLRLTALASTHIQGTTTEEQVTLIRYKRAGNRLSTICRYKIILISNKAKHRVCTELFYTEKIIFTNISRSELLALREDNTMPAIMYVKTALGISVVTEIKKNNKSFNVNCQNASFVLPVRRDHLTQTLCVNK